METHGNTGRTFKISQSRDLREGRVHVTFVEDGELTLVIHLQAWQKVDGSEDWRNYGFDYEVEPSPAGERDSVSAESLQRLLDGYPYWLNLARAAADRPSAGMTRPSKSLRRRGWKPAQPGRSATFLTEIADEYVRRFDGGENAVSEIARAHGVKPGTVSKWLSKVDDERVTLRRAARYRKKP